MKAIFINLLALFLFVHVYGQQTSSKILSQKQVEGIFTSGVKTQFNISYPIRRVYEYTDRSGKSLLVVTESNDSITKDKDTLHYQIKAFNLAYTPAGLSKKWEVTDFSNADTKNSNPETSIWFWTKFFKLQDADNDGLTDPVLVYGSAGDNGYDDGRIKIIIFYKGQKIAIRHQNSVYDQGRNTQVDKAFYTLPVKLQQNVRTIMKEIGDKNFGIFPYGWQKGMDKKKLYLDESK